MARMDGLPGRSYERGHGLGAGPGGYDEVGRPLPMGHLRADRQHPHGRPENLPGARWPP